MKYSYIFAIFTLTIICCACASLGTKTEKDSTSIELKKIPSETEYTFEETIEHISSMRDSVVDSYTKMQELAQDDDANSMGIKSAKKVEKEYGDRINELNNIDFSNMTSNELNEFMVEMSNLITVIREARDALTFG